MSSDEDKGVRTLEKAVKDIVNKINFMVHNQDENGKLIGFSMSFSISKKLSYPLELTKEMIDLFCKAKEMDNKILSLYM